MHAQSFARNSTQIIQAPRSSPLTARAAASGRAPLLKHVGRFCRKPFPFPPSLALSSSRDDPIRNVAVGAEFRTFVRRANDDEKERKRARPSGRREASSQTARGVGHSPSSPPDSSSPQRKRRMRPLLLFFQCTAAALSFRRWRRPYGARKNKQRKRLNRHRSSSFLGPEAGATAAVVPNETQRPNVFLFLPRLPPPILLSTSLALFLSHLLQLRE
ncbi:hypothetical protein MTO96_012662 [Rhipicephalus appendiculatus]